MFSNKNKSEFIKKLKKKRIKLYIAESITGGKFTSELVETEGASKFLDYSIVTYSNKSKQSFLGIENVIKKHGVVSSQVATQMAEKISYKSIFKNKLSIACTGFASEPIDSKKNQQGIVFIAINYKKKNTVIKKIFKKKKRQDIINLTVEEMFKQGNSII
jgi:PncC family amidohydrolase